MGEQQKAQLRMEKYGMGGIPEANICEGYELRVMREDEIKQWEELCQQAFGGEQDFHKIVVERPGYVPDGVFVIVKGSEVVATGTAICNHEQPQNFGYVHMIGAKKGHSGKRLGYEVTAAVLRRLRDDGFTGAELTTDDFRKPAVKIYHELGFIPDLQVSEDMSERWIKLYEEFGWEKNY